ISPLFGGVALKGPANRVMASLGMPSGNNGVVLAYEGLIDLLVVDTSDSGDGPDIMGIPVVAMETRIPDAAKSRQLVERILAL
ncbi:MAG TPA: 2-phospho-L-lactate transferase, partial [Acidimicrobiia bacterium]